MSETTKNQIHTWLLIAVSIGTLGGWVKLSGASEQVDRDHERRITLMEAKFEQAIKEQAAKFEESRKEQAEMAGDLKALRALAEDRSKTAIK
jgi:Tfp pilus assembly protein PilO